MFRFGETFYAAENPECGEKNSLSIGDDHKKIEPRYFSPGYR
jgi:hypothetical protein